MARTLQTGQIGSKGRMCAVPGLDMRSSNRARTGRKSRTSSSSRATRNTTLIRKDARDACLMPHNPGWRRMRLGCVSLEPRPVDSKDVSGTARSLRRPTGYRGSSPRWRCCQLAANIQDYLTNISRCNCRAQRQPVQSLHRKAVLGGTIRDGGDHGSRWHSEVNAPRCFPAIPYGRAAAREDAFARDYLGVWRSWPA